MASVDHSVHLANCGQRQKSIFTFVYLFFSYFLVKSYKHKTTCSCVLNFLMYFLDQELIPFRFPSSRCSCSSSCFSWSCWGDAVRKKAQGFIVSNRIGMKFGRIVRGENTYVYHSTNDGVGFSIWRQTVKTAAMTSFRAEKCCRLASKHEASAGRLCSSVGQFLIYSTFLIMSTGIAFVTFQMLSAALARRSTSR